MTRSPATGIPALQGGEEVNRALTTPAAELLGRVDAKLGTQLFNLVALKPGSHYGHALLDAKDRAAALRAAHALVEAATVRTT